MHSSFEQMVPTEEEAKSFSGWLSKAGHSMEQLSAPERFLAVMGAVPRIRAKCAALLFRAQLPGLLADVHAALQCLLTACAQVPVSPPQRAAFLVLCTSCIAQCRRQYC